MAAFLHFFFVCFFFGSHLKKVEPAPPVVPDSMNGTIFVHSLKLDPMAPDFESWRSEV